MPQVRRFTSSAENLRDAIMRPNRRALSEHRELLNFRLWVSLHRSPELQRQRKPEVVGPTDQDNCKYQPTEGVSHAHDEVCTRRNGSCTRRYHGHWRGGCLRKDKE